MKRRGFTLIELLAVIVVLAIIALIATPIVTSIIKNAKKSAAERSAGNYIEAMEIAIAESKAINKTVKDGEYKISPEGDICLNDNCSDKLSIDVNGNKPNSGKITIKDGEVSKIGTIIVLGDYNVRYKNNKLTAIKAYNDVLCKANTQKITAMVWDGSGDLSQESSYARKEVGLLASEAASPYDIGVTYTCELGDGEKNTFYVLETNGEDVSLIAGMNLGSPVAWTTKDDYTTAGGTDVDWNKACTNCGNNNLGPITANKVLQERTSVWTKLNKDQVTLPTGKQIAIAGGDNNWTDSQYTGTKLSTWLYSYTKSTSDTTGYWVSTPYLLREDCAWITTYDGRLFYYRVRIGNTYGIRPVITISKLNLS